MLSFRLCSLLATLTRSGVFQLRVHNYFWTQKDNRDLRLAALRKHDYQHELPTTISAQKINKNIISKRKKGFLVLTQKCFDSLTTSVLRIKLEKRVSNVQAQCPSVFFLLLLYIYIYFFFGRKPFNQPEFHPITSSRYQLPQ